MGNLASFENLVLIVGTNPLPDLVTAKHFIAEYPSLQNVWLIYSSGYSGSTYSTMSYADNLAELIKKQKTDLHISFVGLKNIESIDDIVTDLVKSINKEVIRGGFHVNLTGGTKTMGIGVYEYFRDSAEFSYLSARDFHLFKADGGLVSPDLRNKVKVTLGEMIFLLGYEFFAKKEKDVDKNSKGYRPPIDYKAAFDTTISDKFFSDSINDGSVLEFVNAYWPIRDLFVNGKGDPHASKVLEINFTKLLEKRDTIGETFFDVLKSLPKDFRCINEDGNLLSLLPNNKQLALAVKYIDGKWFEKYIVDILEGDSYFKDFDISSSKEIYKSEWNDINLKFELDIIVIYGYQLFVISVTTDSRLKLLKNKAFEVINRAKQIGGQEARSALICLANNVNITKINKQMLIETGSGSSFMALGIDDIKKEYLLAKLKEFIKKEK